MVTLPDTIAARRQAQMFPTLTEEEMSRAERFGARVAFADGERLFTAGEPGAGLYLLTSGRVRITRRDGLGHVALIVEHGPGAFVAEVGQLSGRAALVDGHAVGPVEAVLLAPERLRALMVAEAALGERIMRSLILRRSSLIETGDGGPLFIGRKDSSDTARLASFVSRNGYPYRMLDPADDEDAAQLVARYAPQPAELPLVVTADGSVLRNPSEGDLARALGMIGSPEAGRVFDVAVVGAGPAGLATAVYAASEGLSVVVLDARAFGGQAGASARIENYFGFPTGITGQALAARAFVQAQKFGAEIAIPARVERLVCGAGEAPHRLELEGGGAYLARTVVIASGARYRRPRLENLAHYESRGVWYWASPVEARVCAGAEVVLVGGGNSAGQAAVFLSGHAARVRVMVRGPSLEASMSRYLIDRIEATPNIAVMTRTELVALVGSDAGLERVRWRGPEGEAEAAIRHVFLFVGAEPASEWLAGCAVALDDKGFVVTGPDGAPTLATSRPGIFAVGDVRSGSVKRVGGAIGEGAAVVAQIHAHLAALADERPA
ncbi:FAD-dependent oxidoreductase [Salinarimonas chemoclinalis]|uniref:FAD-dependent oxidoreductase n=1 Tax=Salinarimonas chemoclinalis TaxID=3241599 RepID=UPI003556BB61